MNMRHVILAGVLVYCINTVACKPTTITQPLAPGYLNTTDQTMGEALAALNAFANQEKVNFAALPADKQTVERPFLNDLIAATNLANEAYRNYHGSTMTQQQAQTAITVAQEAQAKIVNLKEGK